MNANLTMKGINIMKKNRLLAVFTAASIAVANLFSPAYVDNGFNVQASAAGTVFNDGGLTLTQVTDDDTKVFRNDTDYINTLKTGDDVQLNILIPNFEQDLFSITLRIAYDSSVFDVIEWLYYNDSSTSTYKVGNETINPKNWTYGGNYFLGTRSGDTGFTNGVISVTPKDPLQTDNLLIKSFNTAAFPTDTTWDYFRDRAGVIFKTCSKDTANNDGSDATTNYGMVKNKSYLWLKAIFRVKTSINEETNFSFKIINDATVAVDPSLLTGARSKTEFVYDDDGNGNTVTDQENIWLPDLKNSVVSGTVATTVVRKIKGINFSATNLFKDSNGIPQNWKVDTAAYDTPLTFEVLEPISNTYTLPDGFEEQWVILPGAATPTLYVHKTDVVVKIASDGETGLVEIRGLKPNTTYQLKPNIWCLNEEEIFLTTTSTFNDDKSSSTSNDAYITVKLYGDVDGNGLINSTDATLILRYVVGKSVSEITYSNGTGSDGFKAAEVSGDGFLSSTDATQILRKSIDLPSNRVKSIFDVKP